VLSPQPPIEQEEIDICKVCMLTTFAKLQANNREIDRWQHWTEAVQRTETMNFDKQEQLARKNCHQQVFLMHETTRVEING